MFERDGKSWAILTLWAQNILLLGHRRSPGQPSQTFSCVSPPTERYLLSVTSKTRKFQVTDLLRVTCKAQKKLQAFNHIQSLLRSF